MPDISEFVIFGNFNYSFCCFFVGQWTVLTKELQWKLGDYPRMKRPILYMEGTHGVIVRRDVWDGKNLPAIFLHVKGMGEYVCKNFEKFILALSIDGMNN